MLKMIWDLLKDLYIYEGDQIDALREDCPCIRPSTILLLLIGLFYTLSPIDIIAEAVVKPRFMGYIDDIILDILILGYTYSDVKGVMKYGEDDRESCREDIECEQTEIQHNDVPVTEEPVAESKISQANGPGDEYIDNVYSDVSNESNNREIISENSNWNRSNIGNSDSDIDSDIEQSSRDNFTTAGF